MISHRNTLLSQHSSTPGRHVCPSREHVARSGCPTATGASVTSTAATHHAHALTFIDASRSRRW